MRKHLKTLGLQESATNEEIQAAYERLSNDLDPKNNDNEVFFKEEFEKVLEAYKALSSASILAKVSRDERLMQLDLKYPQWGFRSHKGYGTKFHMEAIRQYGFTPFHRRSFEPMKSMVKK